MNWINSIKFGTLNSGVNSGMLSFIIDFNGLEADMEKDEITEALILIRNFKVGVNKRVYLKGWYGPEPQMLTFCKALKDTGFEILAECNGQIYHSWFAHVNWLIVNIDEKPWPMFQCSELRYYWDDASYGEPEWSPELKSTLFELAPSKGITALQTIKFITQSTKSWRLLIPLKKTYLIDVWETE